MLASVLAPEAFGLMALVAVIMAGLQSFTDLGISPSLIMSPNAERAEFRSTAWTLTVIRGFALWIVVCVLAWPLSRLYDHQLMLLLPVASLVLVLSAFQSTQIVILQRHLRYREVTILEIGTGIVWIATSVVLAFVLRSVWAMVIGTLIGIALKTILSWTLSTDHRDRFVLDRAAAGELIRFGRWIFVSTIISFLALQLDKLLLGKLLTLEQFGLYSIALSLVVLPRELLSKLAGAVQFPLLAGVFRREPGRLASAVSASRGPLLVLGATMTAAVVLLSEPFFTLLYDARYSDCAHIAQWLSWPIMLSVLTATVDRAALAAGNSKLLAAANVVRLLGTAAACILGNVIYGFPGFVAGMAFGAAVAHAFVVVGLRRYGIRTLKQDALVVGLLAVVSVVAMSGVGNALPLGSWHGVQIGHLMVATVVLGPLGVWAARSILMQVRST